MVIVNFLKETPFSEAQLARLKTLGAWRETPPPPEGGFSEKDAAAFLRDADYAIVAPTSIPRLSRNILGSAPRLKGVVVNTTNFAWVDLEAARERHVEVLNPAGYSTNAVAEFAIGLMFAAARHIAQAASEVKRDGVRSWERYEGKELLGKTLGVVGFGTIGERTAELAECLGMRIVAYNRTPKTHAGVEFLEKNELLRRADIVSLHLALDEGTKGFIGARELALMKPETVLVNVSLEGLVDQRALREALKAGKLFGYAFELDEGRGSEEREDILKIDRVIATPHSAWFTPEARARSMELIVSRLEELMKKVRPDP